MRRRASHVLPCWHASDARDPHALAFTTGARTTGSADGDALGDARGDGDARGVGDERGVAETEPLGDADADADGDADGVADATADGDAALTVCAHGALPFTHCTFARRS